MSKKIWIIGKHGIVSAALGQYCKEACIEYLQTSQQQVNVLSSEAIADFMQQHQLSHVINCSAYTAVDTAEQEPDKAYAVNVQGVKNITNACLERQVKLIHYSTDYVFDGAATKPYCETDPVHPLNVYGKTKEEGEQWIVSHDPKALVIRTSWVFFSSGHSFVRAMIRLMLKQQELFVCDDQIGKATYAQDLVEATLEIKNLQGLFHYANAGVISRYAYAERIYEVLKLIYPKLMCQKINPIKTAKQPKVARRPSYSALDTSKIESYLKKPIPSYQEGLKKVIPILLKQELSCE